MERVGVGRVARRALSRGRSRCRVEESGSSCGGSGAKAVRDAIRPMPPGSWADDRPMSVSSTRPSGPPPRRSGRVARALRSRQFWTGAGALLGVAATLWATLVGQTVPQLLTDENATLVRFRGKVDEQCPQQAQPTIPGLLLQTNGGLSARRYVHRDELMHEEAALSAVVANLAALDPPHQYQDEYAAFQKAWVQIRDLIPPLIPAPTTRAVRGLSLDERRERAVRLATGVDTITSNAQVMRLERCANLGSRLRYQVLACANLSSARYGVPSSACRRALSAEP
jgi:hypothetical protein